MADETQVDLRAIRKELGFTQAEFAEMIGVSPRTVQSCEQGWRNPSPAVEKAALLLLLAHRRGPEFGVEKCWETLDCSEEERKACLVYQTGQGHICWLLNGNICKGVRHRSWEEKKVACAKCDFFKILLCDGIPTR
jgi:DNA-binding XRE family transcriptional regulator